jgi:hypothetical protein
VETLPVETITNILASVDNTSTLAACALASHTFHDAVIPLLYHTVVLYSSWNRKVDDYSLFFHGILGSSEGARARKLTYLSHLKQLVLYSPPTEPLVFPSSFNSADLFPSLHYIEFVHDEGSGYLPLFSHFFNIRHVCIRTFESGRLYHPEMESVFAKWKDVEVFTLYNWYASDNGARDVQKAGIPLAWTKLRQIIIYPELTSHGVILCVRPRHEIPIPFPYMPNPSQFPLLKKFTIMIPAQSPGRKTYWKYYQKYAAPLSNEQKALIELALVETINSQWP